MAAFKTATCTSRWETAVSGVQCDLTMAGRASDLVVTPLSSRALRLTWKANADQANDEEGFEVETLISHAIGADIAGNAATLQHIGSDPQILDAARAAAAKETS